MKHPGINFKVFRRNLAVTVYSLEWVKHFVGIIAGKESPFWRTQLLLLLRSPSSGK